MRRLGAVFPTTCCPASAPMRASEYPMGKVIELLDIRFIPTTEAPVQDVAPIRAPTRT
jgi:hypothetical protein